MQSYLVGYNYQVRPKGELCECGHDKDVHSSPFTGDIICYGGEDCKCSRVFPKRVRIPIVGTTQQVNLNIRKPQLRPERCQAKIIKIIGAERVFHSRFGQDVFVLCKVEVNGMEMSAYVEWVDEK